MPVIGGRARVASRAAVAHALLRRLARDRRAVAIVEFAYLLPLFVIVGMGGIEFANFAVTHMRINEIAISLADNVSRAKQASVTGAPRLREFDIQDAFAAAARQGADLNLLGRGRIVVSSLEVNSQGGQWIHWQRCTGRKTYEPRYGREGAGRTGTSLVGMGPAGRMVTADANSAVIFVEVAYDYRTLLMGVPGVSGEIRHTAAMTVRDDRDLTQIYPSPAVAVARC